MEFQWIFNVYFGFSEFWGAVSGAKFFPHDFWSFFLSSGVPFAAQSFFSQDFWSVLVLLLHIGF